MDSFDLYRCMIQSLSTVGSGNAGSCAAFAAAEAGCDKVLIVDVCPSEWVGGNGYFTAGAFRTVHGGLKDLLPIVNNVSAEQAGSIDMDPYSLHDFVGDIMRLGDGKPDPVLAHAVVASSRDTIAWLADKVGLPFMFSFHRQAYNVNGRQRFWGGMVLCTEDGGKGLIAAHQRALARAKVQVWFNCRAVEITMKDGAVSGLVVEKEGKKMHLATRAVVLAAGGFESNPQLREKHLGAGWERAIEGTGDGFQLAAAVGARQTGDWAGCHSTCWDANAPAQGQRDLTNQFTKSGYPLGLMINSAGQRFVDEGEDFRNYTYAKFGRAILKQPGGYVFQVWDSKVIGSLRVEEYGDGIVEKIFADRIDDLADKLVVKGLKEKEEFVQTVKQFNQAVKTIKDRMSTKDLTIPKSNWALTIDQPPFMAVKVACGVTFTFGGLEIDPETAGLFCTGEMVGLFHGNYPGGSGLMAGAVFGRKAGQAAAKLV
ncbi:FAD binding domain-containing protein [Mycena metata]|uniref:FAD binding domain-containing protein n=1 Tax=Mycena metata TaxID=1033252 RepID=A0AAD7KHC4_9AGAR|nr:FAD binding domain-containing protein [Mycena metata]